MSTQIVRFPRLFSQKKLLREPCNLKDFLLTTSASHLSPCEVGGNDIKWSRLSGTGLPRNFNRRSQRIMKIRVFLITIAAVVFISLAVKHQVPSSSAAGAPVAMHSTLPSPAIAKMLLNSTHRHREWVNVPVGSAGVRAFIVYPERSDNAPVVMVSAGRQGASDWIRAVADQIAAEGFIAVVPDVLSGLGPFGGDTNAFASPEAVAAA